MKGYFSFLMIVTFFIASSSLWAEKTSLSSSFNLDSEGIALSGYDPISYHSGKPLRGKKELSFEYDGALYLFSSRANLERFAATPEMYLPAFGGWCAWAMIDGEKVEVDPETYKIINGTLYLYYNSFFVNTLSKWNTRAESEPEKDLIEKAQSEWTLIQQTQ